MGLFNRKRKQTDGDEAKKEKGGWRRPANTAFKQQRLKAWQPILTPKTVLPTLFAIGIVFAPIGGLLIWGSSGVSEITLDYTDCDKLSPSASNSSLSFTDMPSSKVSYRLSSDTSNLTPSRPQYAFLNNTGNTTLLDSDISAQYQCIIDFDIVADLKAPVFLYYKLTNFYQNHRRYVSSLDSDQLQGKLVTAKTLDSSDCSPLGSRDGIAIYPCGLIANSIFNDTFTSPELLNPANSSVTSTTYQFSSKNIAWPGEANKYVVTPIGNGGYASADDIVPPPNWLKRFPNYTNDNIPDLKSDEHFQNWMRTAGLPTFTKLYGRNDSDGMAAGTYRIIIGMNFPVASYGGTKSMVISTISWIGGKNPFLGWAYVAAAALFCLLAVAGTIRHLVKPRPLGDMSLLSWNR
ncbi:cell cycle control protein [Fistulina hepatica ATCC 64428]|nr:cell cycle control protein [Fistulina hepatica ATCC 64428]